MTGDDVIEVSAVVLRSPAGHVLTVRKRGTQRFMLPGGKPEAGETPAQTAVRECAEEIGVELEPGALRELGVFTDAAANEADRLVRGTVYVHPAVPVVEAAREIAELRWLDPEAEPLPPDLAPMLEHQVLPALRRLRATA